MFIARLVARGREKNANSPRDTPVHSRIETDGCLQRTESVTPRLHGLSWLLFPAAYGLHKLQIHLVRDGHNV
jgi:hypothetical protein